MDADEVDRRGSRRTRTSPSRRGPSGSCWRSRSSGSCCPTSRCCAGRCCGRVVISIGVGYLPEHRLDALAVAHPRACCRSSRSAGGCATTTSSTRLDLLRRRALVGARRRRSALFAVAGFVAWFFVDVLARDEPAANGCSTTTATPTSAATSGGPAACVSRSSRSRSCSASAFFALHPARHALVDALRPVHDVRLPAALVRALPVPRDRDPARRRTDLAVAADRDRRLGRSSPWRWRPSPCARSSARWSSRGPAWLFADPALAGREGRRSDPTGSRRPREAATAPVRPDPRQNG